MPVDVAPGLLPIPPEWDSYFIAIAEVSATLAGLSFVAVSAHPPIFEQPRTRSQAQRSLISFVIIFCTALVMAMPGFSMYATAQLVIWACLAGIATMAQSIIRSRGAMGPLEAIRSSGTLTSTLFSFGSYVAGIAWGAVHLSPNAQPISLVTLASGMVWWIAWSAILSWRLMIAGIMARVAQHHLVESAVQEQARHRVEQHPSGADPRTATEQASLSADGRRTDESRPP